MLPTDQDLADTFQRHSLFFEVKHFNAINVNSLTFALVSACHNGVGRKQLPIEYRNNGF